MNNYIKKKNYYVMQIRGTKNECDVLIDIDDYERVSKKQWYSKDGKGYIAAKFGQKTVKLHRWLMGVTDRKEIVDHINKNVYDNRKKNLRVTTSTVNNLNSSFSKNNTSGRTGVYKFKKSWKAQVTFNKQRHSKSFSIQAFGEEKAFKMACEQREAWEKEFNITTSKTIND